MTVTAEVLCTQGRVVALDKSKNKLAKLVENVQRWNVDCIEVYNFDATKLLDQNAGCCCFIFTFTTKSVKPYSERPTQRNSTQLVKLSRIGCSEHSDNPTQLIPTG